MQIYATFKKCINNNNNNYCPTPLLHTTVVASPQPSKSCTVLIHLKIKCCYFHRHFKEADLKSVPAIVQQLAKVMQSQPMFKFLRTLTGLELAAVPLSDEDESSDEDDDKGKVSYFLF